MKRHPLAWALLIALLAGCAGPGRNYRPYLDNFPKSVLVIPPMNNSLEVEASGMFLSTITTQLAERGYYVLPVAVVDAVFKENGVPLPPEMHQIAPAKLKEIFGADAVLYVTINKWTTKYLVVNATTTVDLVYRLVDLDNGVEIWNWRQQFHYSPSSQQSGLVGKMVVAAVHAARTGSGRIERDVAAAANVYALGNAQHGIILGHRHPAHEKELQRVMAAQLKYEQREAERAQRAAKRGT